MSDATATTDTAVAANTPDPLGHFQDTKDSDITLRCSDKRELHVYMLILSLVSPVFRDMFTLPPPTGDREERRVVDITEGGRTMELLLQFCYPQENPTINDLSELHRVLRACDKYQMDAMTKIVAGALSALSRQEPLRVFCIAHATRLSAVARQAAFDCLQKPEAYLIDSDVPELHLLSATTFVELVRYYRRCVKAAIDTVSFESGGNTDMGWITNKDSCWFQCRKCDPYIFDPGVGFVVGSPGMRIHNRSKIVHPRRWWTNLMGRVREELADSPLNFSARRSLRYEIPLQTLQCPKCGPSCLNDLLPFMKEMETAIVSSMRAVELKLDISS